MTKTRSEPPATTAPEREQRPERTQVARTKKTIKEEIAGEKFKLALGRIAPKHLTPDRVVTVAISAMTRNPDLGKCDPATFYQALIKLTALGLEPDGYQAHLIPFWNSKRGCYECQLIVDYKGLVEVAMRTGMFSQPPIAQVVRWNDDFVWNKGVVERHVVDWRSERGPVYAAYVIVKTKAGGEVGHVMSKDALEAIRKRSKSPDKGPWVTDPEEMMKKTVFRQMSKWLPRSPEFRDTLEVEDGGEDKAFAAARPIFDATPGRIAENAPIPLFGDPGEGENEFGGASGDLVNRDTHSEPLTEGQPSGSEPRTLGAADKSQQPTNEAHGATEAPAAESEKKPEQNYVRAVRGLLKLSGHTEGQLLEYMRGRGLDESLGSLEEVAMTQPSWLREAHDKWTELAEELKKLPKGK